MENRIDYISSPGTIISFIIFIFTLGVTYSKTKSEIESLKNRLGEVERDVKDINADEIKTQLASIKTDLAWIKQTLSSKN